MILKLSLSNVKKSINDYLVYFLTLTFAVCLFYTFNSFQSQSAIMELNESQSLLLMTIGLLMQVLSVFVAIVLGFLILYANNFLIKRRKKEFGLYLILGMPKKMISKILICETLFVGLLSLIVGLLLGVILSQFFSILTAQLFQATYQYHFIYSFSTMLLTCLTFSCIFFIVMIFNTTALNKVKVIDLLNAKAKNENVRIKRLNTSILLFILSLCFLGVAYFLALDMQLFFVFFLPIILMGIIGTILFFMSLSGFFIQFIRVNQNFYFKGLNSFILKQVNSKINTNYVSMSVICLLLLLSIGAFATGFNLSNAFSSNMEQKTPYPLTIMNHSALPLNELLSESELESVQYADEMNRYQATINDGDFLNRLIAKAPTFDWSADMIPLSNYNQLLKHLGQEPLTLAEHEVLLLKGQDFGLDLFEEGVAPFIELQGNKMKVMGIQENINIETNHQSGYVFALIANDQWIKENNLQLTDSFFNIQTKNEEQTKSLLASLKGKLSYVSRAEVYENGMSMGILFSYIGLYLGFVFLMASAVILALQQLSHANDNKKQYQCLLNLGADQKMIHRALFKQIAIYFGVPLILAIVHSYIGIRAVMNGFSIMFGFIGLWKSSILTAMIFLLIYGLYFFITYFGCKKIITQV